MSEDEDFRDLHSRADSGDSILQQELGVRLIEGDGVSRDTGAALAWLRPGWGLERDADMAQVWYRIAAEEGHGDAAFELSVLMAAEAPPRDDAPFLNESVDADWARWQARQAESRRWRERAIRRGSPSAFADAADRSENPEQELMWTYLAACSFQAFSPQDPNHRVYASAQRLREELAEEQVLEAKRLAIDWVARNQRYPALLHNLGRYYAAGEGVQRDLVEAYLWLAVAERGGWTPARKTLANVVSEMTPDERVRAAELLDLVDPEGGDANGGAAEK